LLDLSRLHVLGDRTYGDKKNDKKADGLVGVKTEEGKMPESPGNVTRKKHTKMLIALENSFMLSYEIMPYALAHNFEVY